MTSRAYRAAVGGEFDDIFMTQSDLLIVVQLTPLNNKGVMTLNIILL
jgi:hypothetical protein